MCGKKSKPGLGKEETENRIEDILERLGLGIMVLTAHFASEKDAIEDIILPLLCAHIFPRSALPNPSSSSVILSLVLVLSQAVNETLTSTEWK